LPPVIDTVVAGDVIYNEIHQMLGLSGPDAWQFSAHAWFARRQNKRPVP
jgi:hypothetical protein